ncbi:MAG: hypothetical protein WC087_01010 [Candidatus Paceibacterota bacterium]
MNTASKRMSSKRTPRDLVTACEKLKTLGDSFMKKVSLGVLRRWIDEKGFSLDAVQEMSNTGRWGNLFSELVLRVGDVGGVLNGYAQALPFIDSEDNLPEYRGEHLQNRRIDLALANSGLRSPEQFLGEGAATFFVSQSTIPNSLSRVPIAVVGYGAAGILITYALRQLGFNNITIYEKSKPLGIWSQNNVFGLSRNNPRQLQFFDRILRPAPGDGEEVRRFLDNLAYRSKKETVVKIVPGKLKHVLHFANGKKETFPIVINTIGLGKPKPLSDPSRMTTEATTAQAGSRWQKVIDRDEVEGKRIILVGLGNSTAEMLFQIHNLIDRGAAVDYRVLTHYPEECVYNPNTTVVVDGVARRLFRDVSLPNLVDFQGDLARSRSDYYRALHNGKILYGVNRWEVAGKEVYVFRKEHSEVEKIPFGKIMTLIGYGNSPEVMKSMGCTYDPVDKCPLFDYDGEFIVKHSPDPKKRILSGYYGFGSVLETPHNPNAIVIPGMLHRIGDVLFGVVMRSAEYQLAR